MTERDNVISLSDRVLGGCPACGEPVLFAESFIRAGRAFVHVACAVRMDVPPSGGGHDFPRLVPPGDLGA
jgi:hypothetical protein